MKNTFLNRCRKRTSFKKLFGKAMIPVVLITAVFAVILLLAMEFFIYRDAHDQFMLNRQEMISNIHSRDVNTLGSGRLMSITAHNLGLNGYDVSIKEYSLTDSYGSSRGTVFGVLLDENGDVAASSREKFWVMIRFDADDKYKDFYSCDLDIPETEELRKELERISEDRENILYMKVNSLYVDKESLKMVPHEVTVGFQKYADDGNKLIKEEQKDITINFEREGYEFIEVKGTSMISKNTDEPYPRASVAHYIGTDCGIFDSLLEKYRPKANMSSAYFSSENIGTFVNEDYSVDSIKIDGKEYCLITVYRIDGWTSPIRSLYFRAVLIFFVFAAIIAALLCWRKDIFNRSMYAFEDYQRNLTNSLAHDLKTPLMAIEGYAENLLDGMMTEEEKTKYLNSIVNSVKYTDKIILDTLELNTLESRSGNKNEEFGLRQIGEKAFEKYKTILEENGIKLSFDGDSQVCADKKAVERIIENLVSNAVKYTEKGGIIKVAAGKKHISITNTVRKKLDVSKFKQPFVKGDSSRSGMNGNGLGLAIADMTAAHIGGKLSLSCSDKEFTAELKLK